VFFCFFCFLQTQQWLALVLALKYEKVVEIRQIDGQHRPLGTVARGVGLKFTFMTCRLFTYLPQSYSNDLGNCQGRLRNEHQEFKVVA